CPCRLTVKTYPGTSEVLGFYRPLHSHPLGADNLKYMCLDTETHQEIEKLLWQGMDPKKVVCHVFPQHLLVLIRVPSQLDQITKNMYHESKLKDLQETIRLASSDGESVLEWVQKLRDEGHFIFLKRSDEGPPPGSDLECDSFVLIIQTKYQRGCWEKYGSRFAGIDGTHNTT
ncbi:hypothetical protein DFH07DRAFT_693742, partial [Mycena maculata]